MGQTIEGTERIYGAWQALGLIPPAQGSPQTRDTLTVTLTLTAKHEDHF